jgi:hypothetical protein
MPKAGASDVYKFYIMLLFHQRLCNESLMFERRLEFGMEGPLILTCKMES